MSSLLKRQYRKRIDQSMNFCFTEIQIADIFTKALNREQFERNRLKLGLIKIT